jgi:hypothetical protein
VSLLDKSCYCSRLTERPLGYKGDRWRNAKWPQLAVPKAELFSSLQHTFFSAVANSILDPTGHEFLRTNRKRKTKWSEGTFLRLWFLKAPQQTVTLKHNCDHHEIRETWIRRECRSIVMKAIPKAILQFVFQDCHSRPWPNQSSISKNIICRESQLKEECRSTGINDSKSGSWTYSNLMPLIDVIAANCEWVLLGVPLDFLLGGNRCVMLTPAHAQNRLA